MGGVSVLPVQDRNKSHSLHAYGNGRQVVALRMHGRTLQAMHTGLSHSCNFRTWAAVWQRTRSSAFGHQPQVPAAAAHQQALCCAAAPGGAAEAHLCHGRRQARLQQAASRLRLLLAVQLSWHAARDHVVQHQASSIAAVIRVPPEGLRELPEPQEQSTVD